MSRRGASFFSSVMRLREMVKSLREREDHLDEESLEEKADDLYYGDDGLHRDALEPTYRLRFH